MFQCINTKRIERRKVVIYFNCIVPAGLVEFKCVFQEIWDFKLNFLNWKASSIFPPSKLKRDNTENEVRPNTFVKVSLVNKKLFASNTSVFSEIARNTE